MIYYKKMHCLVLFWLILTGFLFFQRSSGCQSGVTGPPRGLLGRSAWAEQRGGGGDAMADGPSTELQQ